MRREGGWTCTACRKKSLTWSRLAPQVCTGNPADTWTLKAKEAAPSGLGSSNKHHIVVSDPLFWCTTCGAYGETAPKMLISPCNGRHTGRRKKYGMREQLRCLRAGVHPKTLLSIPPPVPLQQWEATKLARANPDPSPSTAPKLPPSLEDDGTEFTSAFLRRGCPSTSLLDSSTEDRQPKRARVTPIQKLRLKIALGNAEQKGFKRKLELLLTSVELEDPDLIGFWTDEDTGGPTATTNPPQPPPKPGSSRWHAGSSTSSRLALDAVGFDPTRPGVEPDGGFAGRQVPA